MGPEAGREGRTRVLSPFRLRTRDVARFQDGAHRAVQTAGVIGLVTRKHHAPFHSIPRRGAKLAVEYLAGGTSCDLADTVAIERSESLVVGQDKPRLHELRVAHLFRKEDGACKLIHRHADPLTQKMAPDAIFKR